MSRHGAARPPRAASALSRFQEEFARVLLADSPAPDVSPDVAALARQPGFAVYRNTVLKGCIDALQANYPAVTRLVGEEWFRAAAAVYVRANLPVLPSLVHYGTAFADFLAGFGPAAELPYLPEVARLDRFWTEAHVAPDEDPLAPEALAGVEADDLQDSVLRPHASARWAWFHEQPIYTIWSRARAAESAKEAGADAPDFEWRGEGALVVRPRDAVRWIPIGRAACAFLDACGAGRTLADASASALDADPTVDLSALGATLFAAGIFAAMRPSGA